MSGLYTSNDGYKVFMVSLKVESTYGSLIMGTAETYSHHVLENLQEHFSFNIGENKPLYVIKPNEFPLPKFYWIAELESRTGVHSEHPNYNSHLYLCWYSDKTEISIDTQITEALKNVNWGKSADDYDITFF